MKYLDLTLKPRLLSKYQVHILHDIHTDTKTLYYIQFFTHQVKQEQIKWILNYNNNILFVLHTSSQTTISHEMNSELEKQHPGS